MDNLILPAAIAIAVAILIIVILHFIAHKKPKVKDDFTMAARKKQTKNKFRNNAVKVNLENKFEKKAKLSQRRKYNILFEQAGINLRYGEYKIITVGLVVIVFIIMFTFSRSFLISLFVAVACTKIPKEIIVMQKNKRLAVLEKQVGSFLKLSIERYKLSTDFAQTLKDCLQDFEGQEPFYTELSTAVVEVELNTPVEVALENLARRCGNLYLKRLATYYAITKELGTAEARNNTLNQAYIQYNENIQIKELLKQEIQGPKTEAFIMLAAVPAMFLYQSLTTEGYITFMFHTFMGQVGTAFLLLVCFGSLWFINAKISAPIDKTQNSDEVK